MNRENLFARLAPTAYDTMVEATRICRAHGHGVVDLEHWLWAMLARGQTDVPNILRHYGVDPGSALTSLERRLKAMPRSGSPVSDLSPRVETAVERGILAGQMLRPGSQVRTGYILAGVLHDAALQGWLYRTCKLFEQIPLPLFFDNIEHTLVDSSEDAGSAERPAHHEKADPASDPLLKWCTDLTAEARAGNIDPVIGRERELAQVIDIISRRRQNNPFLVGEAGVGKTAVVEALAQRIVSGDVPPSLANARIINLDLGRLQAGAGARGEFESRLKSLVDEVIGRDKRVILFCDEAHTLIGAGGQAGTGDAVNLLKPMLARGTLRMIAATTWSEYKQFIEPDAALTRRFQAVAVGEPDEPTACDMLRSIADKFAAHHGVVIRDNAVEAAVRLSVRHLPTRQLPDKAISLLDTACARVAQSQHVKPAILQIHSARLAALQRHRDALEADPVEQDCDKTSTTLHNRIGVVTSAIEQLERRVERERELALQLLDAADTTSREARSNLARSLEAEQGDDPLVCAWVDAQVIAKVLADWTGIPVARMLTDDIERVLRFEQILSNRVHGQPQAMARLAQSVRIARSGLSPADQPLLIALLAGPPGTGKTQTALALADATVGGEHNMITLNMSEFRESHTASTLKGAPPGYVGFGRGGKLTEAVRRKPHCVVLLDEFDKAHNEVHDLFHQVFDKGWMEDGEGRPISFRQSFIVLTTNVGAQAITDAVAADADVSDKALERLARQALLDVFPESLLARMQIVPFRPLSLDALVGISCTALASLADRLASEAAMTLRLDGPVAAWFAGKASQMPNSGRAVNEVLAETLLPALSRELLERKRDRLSLDTVTLECDGDALTVAYS